MDHAVNAIIRATGGIPPELVIFFISVLPLLELRGGILAAGLLRVDMLQAFGICLVGTLLPVPFILIFLRRILDWLHNTRFVKLVDRLEEKLEQKSRQIEKYKTVGLFLLVAVPIPGFGAWTGAGVAALLRMRFRDAMVSAILGTIVADLLMCLISYGVLGRVW